MTSSRVEQVDIVDADGEYTVAFQAQFAAYVAELEADVEHPTRGAECRKLLAMDREELRALLALPSLLAKAGPPPLLMLVSAVAVLASLLVVLFFIWWLL